VTVREATATDVQGAAFRSKLAADYLVSVQLPNGLFAYEYDFAPAALTEDDNIVRQAGTAFAVGLFLNRSTQTGYRVYAERAIRALAEYSVPHADGLVVTGDGEPAQAPIGATALALLAELNYVEATGDGRYAGTRAGWTAALMGQQLRSGGFAASPGSDAESPFYNGEAWLALAHFHRLFPDDADVAVVLARADAYLLSRYRAAPDVAFFQWGLMAAAVRYAATGDRRFLAFIAVQSNGFLSDWPSVNPDTNSCAAVEGLAAAAAILFAAGGEARDLASRLAARVEEELSKDLRLQVMPGQDRIWLGERRYLVDPEISRFAGAFLNGRYQSRTRIDTTVHCLSALINYADMHRAAAGDG
jgi:hypothetical protein